MNPSVGTLASVIRQRRTAITADELAEILSVSKKLIYRMAKQGKMPSIRIAGTVRFDPGATAHWVESGSVM